jgi:hypothetical protein
MSDGAWEFVSDKVVPFILVFGLLPAAAAIVVYVIG